MVQQSCLLSESEVVSVRVHDFGVVFGWSSPIAFRARPSVALSRLPN